MEKRRRQPLSQKSLDEIFAKLYTPGPGPQPLRTSRTEWLLIIGALTVLILWIAWIFSVAVLFGYFLLTGTPMPQWYYWLTIAALLTVCALVIPMIWREHGAIWGVVTCCAGLLFVGSFLLMRDPAMPQSVTHVPLLIVFGGVYLFHAVQAWKRRAAPYAKDQLRLLVGSAGTLVCVVLAGWYLWVTFGLNQPIERTVPILLLLWPALLLSPRTNPFR